MNPFRTLHRFRHNGTSDGMRAQLRAAAHAWRQLKLSTRSPQQHSVMKRSAESVQAIAYDLTQGDWDE